MMTQYEYDFLASRWEEPKGAAYNAVYEFCHEFGWIDGFNYDDTPSVTEKGHEAIKKFLTSS